MACAGRRAAGDPDRSGRCAVRRVSVPRLGGRDAALRAQPRQRARIPRRRGIVRDEGRDQVRPRAGAQPQGGDSRPSRSERADGQGPRQDARVPVPRERKRRLAQRREAGLEPVGPRRVGLPSQMARGARVGARRLRPRAAAEARGASREPRRERLLQRRLRRSAHRHARRLRLGPRGQRQRRPRRRDRAHPLPAVSAFARHVLRIGHVGARIPAEPARRKDRRARRIRRSRHPARRAVVEIPSGRRQLPDRRSQQRVLREAAGHRVPEDRRGRRVPARARAGRLRLRRATTSRRPASRTSCSRAASPPTSS